MISLHHSNSFIHFTPSFATAARRAVPSPSLPPCGVFHTCTWYYGENILSRQVEDANHRVLYDLAASTSRERAYWMDVLMKASSFSKGPVEEQRNVALNKRLFVTTRSEKKRGFVGGEVDNSIELGWATVHGTSDMPRYAHGMAVRPQEPLIRHGVGRMLVSKPLLQHAS